MYTYLLVLKDAFSNNDFHWYIVFYTFIILRWIIIFYTSSKYKPFYHENPEFFTTVIVPVVDEEPDLFKSVLARISEQKPDEIIIVINGPENPVLYQTSLEAAESSEVPIHVHYTPVPGKRNAIRIGVENSDPRSEISFLVDSDVVWTENVLLNMLMPFACDENIGGVTTRQKILDPDRNAITITASILEEVRAEGSMKGMSVYGKVGCLPGRTIAFRTSILRECMDEFMTETFMGIHKEVSDDRSLTNITLKRGYKTVMQDTAVVYTDCPVNWKKYFRQQLRWAEGSQYNNIRMSLWMLKNSKLMLYIFGTDMLLPFMLFGTIVNSILCFFVRTNGGRLYAVPHQAPFYLSLALMYVGSALTFSIRNVRMLKQTKSEYMYFFPFLVLFLSLFMAPLRIIALSRCADNLSWGTRKTGTSSSGRMLNFYQMFMRLMVIVLLHAFAFLSFYIEYCF